MLIKIKKMLQTYVLARPHVRLSLKVLKAKTDKGDLNYASKIGGRCVSDSGAIIIDAATRILGKRVTDQCQWTVSTWSSASDNDEQAGVENMVISVDRDGVYCFQALVVSRNCSEVSSINNVGQYISVDSRPMSCNRGIFKKIVQRYKCFLRSVVPESEKIKFIDPFLFMNIVCPHGSYDANVEPAKDNVLFLNADIILRLAEKTFKAVYGGPHALAEEHGQLESPLRPQGFKLLLATNHAHPRPQEQSTIHKGLQHAEPAEEGDDREEKLIRNTPRNGRLDTLTPSYELPDRYRESLSDAANTSIDEHYDTHDDTILLNKRLTWKSSMYANDEEDQALEIGQGDLNPEQIAEMGIEDGDSLQDLHLSNPWAYAKMNAKPRSAAQEDTSDELRGNGFLPTPRRQVGDVEINVNSSISPEGPHNLDPFLSPSNTQRQRLIVSSCSSPEPFPYPTKARGKCQASDSQDLSPDSHRHRPAQGALETWAQKPTPCSARAQKLPIRSDEIEGDMHPNKNHQPHNFVSARPLPNGIALSDIPDITQRPRNEPRRKQQHQQSVLNSYVSPVNDLERVWFDTGEKRRPRRSQQTPTKRGQHDSSAAALNLYDNESDTLPQPDHRLMTAHPDIATIMDYEARKQQATQLHRERLRIEKVAEAKRQRTISSMAGSQFGDIPSNSPHKNRYNKAIAALHGPSDRTAAYSATEHTAAFTLGQPIAQQHERDRQEDQSTVGQKRRKSTIRQLENLCAKTYVHDLTLVVSTNEDGIHDLLQRAKRCDDYIRDGLITDGLGSLTLEEREEWERQLNRVVRIRKGDGSGVDEGVEEISFGGLKALEDSGEEAVS